MTWEQSCKQHNILGTLSLSGPIPRPVKKARHILCASMKKQNAFDLNSFSNESSTYVSGIGLMDNITDFRSGEKF